jgi:FkbH-like protein
MRFVPLFRERSMNNQALQNLANFFERNSQQLVNIWLTLGENGPTGLSDEAGDEEFARAQYLTPLARLLIGALRGSSTHRIVYLDERTRYLPPALDAKTRAGLLGRRLAIETTAIADWLSTAGYTSEEVSRIFEQLHSELIQVSARTNVRLLFVGDCIFVETRAFLQQEARDKNIDLDVEHLFFSSGQCALSVDEVLASIKRAPPNMIGMSIFSFDGIPPYTALLGDASALPAEMLGNRVNGLVDVLGDAIDSIREATDAPILVHNACGLPLYRHALRDRHSIIERLRRRIAFLDPLSPAVRRVIRLIAERVNELAATRENTLVIDEIGLVAEGGLRAADRPVFEAGDVPPAVFHPSNFGKLLAQSYIGAVEDYRILGKAKVLLVDFDNTLWSGVMADGSVKHDRKAQLLLKQLKDSGILLVSLSKNDPANIRWSEMALAPDDFVLHKISWQPKPDGVSQAISELDLAPATFVLLDDNPAERALVTEQVPGVSALDPGVPETWRALERWLSFPSTKQTNEARRRTELYREAAERRRSLAGDHDYPSMMRSLKLHIGFRVAAELDMDRLLELTQRTNQFNTTTKRRNAAEMRDLFASSTHCIYVASLRDRFGDLGIVALVIIERTKDSEVVFDSVIMSCRAMGYGLEQAVIHYVLGREPAKRYIGLFYPTERNSPSSGLFKSCGFRVQASTWILDEGDALIAIPSWFTTDN